MNQDKFKSRLENSREAVAMALGSYVALLQKGAKGSNGLAGDIREKLKTIAKPMIKFNEIVDICRI